MTTSSPFGASVRSSEDTDSHRIVRFRTDSDLSASSRTNLVFTILTPALDLAGRGGRVRLGESGGEPRGPLRVRGHGEHGRARTGTSASVKVDSFFLPHRE